MIRDSKADRSSTESLDWEGEANQIGLGQQRDRIELVKLSTASSCLGGVFGTAPITRPATRRSLALGAVETETARLSRRPSVTHGQEGIFALARENQAALYSSPRNWLSCWDHAACALGPG
jgi:hypothetical protein